MRMFILSAVLFFAVGAAQAATLNVVGGQLMGATGVDVGGVLYDVAFVNGTCIDLFNGCDENSDFTFQTFEDAVLATQALSGQVFNSDSALGAFDSIPHLTNGCEPGTFNGVCLVYTPFAVELDGIFGPAASLVYFRNEEASTGLPDSISLTFASSIEANVNTTGQDSATLVVWSTAVVPEPSTALLLGLGLTGLAGKGGRRSRS